MADEGKKISFGFSKSAKKPVLKNIAPIEQKKVDYIECLDGKAIKVIGAEEKKDAEPLIIPLRGSKTWHERIINKTDADIFEPKVTPVDDEVRNNLEIKKEPVDEAMHIDEATKELPETTKIKLEVPDVPEELPKSLEEQAAHEILQDLNRADTDSTPKRVFTLPLNENPSLVGEKESTIEDYENIPIDAYGLAMLRGMGWKPGKGIGKNEKLVEASLPALRPKGMGLGADKAAILKVNARPKTKEEAELTIVTGAYVKIIAGKHQNSYGQIQGLDDDAGRLIIKMALGSDVISMNESVVTAVTKDEYLKNGKVLNAKKYQEYKDKDNDNGHSPVVELSDSDEERNRKKKKESSERRTERKKEKKQRYHSSNSDSSPQRKSRKRRSSENSEAEEVQKRSKKSKKHKSRDSSAERSSRKKRKKDKEREKRTDKRYSESPERRKKRKSKRSRSRSPRR